MNYERINWENAPSTDTPLDADNLNKMDEALDTLNREVAKTRSDVQEVEDTAASLGSQIAGIIRLEDGSTTGDAELINGRVGKDGTTYSTIGDAIRGQIGDLRDHVIEVSDEEPEEFYNKIWVKDDDEEIEIPIKAELDAVEDEVDELNERLELNLFLGTIIANSYVSINGNLANYTGWSRTDYIDISEYSAINMKSSARSIYNFFYDSSKNPIISFTYGTTDTDVIIPSNAKYMVISNTTSDLPNTSGKYTRKNSRIEALESDLNALVEIPITTRAGYYGSGGTFVAEQDETNLEVSTYPIDVKPNQVLAFSLEYPQLKSTWGAYCLYEEDGSFISRTVFVLDEYQLYKGEVTIPNNAYHIIFMYRSFGTGIFKLSSIVDTNSIYDIANSNNNFISIPLTYTDGYIDPYGGYASQTSAKEVYTNKIPVVAGMKLRVSLKFTKPQANWLCYCCYDRSGNFISRTLIAQYTWVDFSTEITVPQNACEILFTFRTYDDATFNVYYESLYKLIADINKYKDYMDVPVNPVKGINHRGWYEAPEDTLVAYKQSRTHGFGYVETDVRLTSDGIPVLLHDTTINRTGRNADGTTISDTVYIEDITYAEAETYDFGIYKGAEYEGTKIPKFEDFIKLCKNIDVHPYIEIEHDATFTQSDVQNLVDIVRRNGMKGNVTFISFSTTYLGYVTAYDSSARVGYIVSDDIADADITATNALKTDNNEVFIDARYDYLTSTGIGKCYDANIPLEVWCPDTVARITALDPYIVGVTSNKFVASKVLFDANI